MPHRTLRPDFILLSFTSFHRHLLSPEDRQTHRQTGQDSHACTDLQSVLRSSRCSSYAVYIQILGARVSVASRPEKPQLASHTHTHTHTSRSSHIIPVPGHRQISSAVVRHLSSRLARTSQSLGAQERESHPSEDFLTRPPQSRQPSNSTSIAVDSSTQ